MTTPRRIVNMGEVLPATKGLSAAKSPSSVYGASTPTRVSGSGIYREYDNNSSMEVIGGINWYYFLVPKPGRSTCLISEVGESRILSMFVVCASLPGASAIIPGKKPKIIHLFAAFNSYLDFLAYARGIPMDNWHFFEVILGDRPQKLYFDIDMHSSIIPGDVRVFADGLIHNLVDRIIKVFSQHGCTIDPSQHILLFSSNPPSQPNPEKISFHVIVNSVIVSNNRENRALANEVLADFPSDYAQCLDDSMYSAKQQFRLFRSMKPYSNRPKMFVDEWIYGSTTIRYPYPEVSGPDEVSRNAVQFAMLFAASCVTVTDNCKLIVMEVETEQLKRRSHLVSDGTTDYDEITITEEMLGLIVERLPKHILQIYRITETIGALIILRRNQPAECEICQRRHDAENAFLRINRLGHVYFYCRRNDEQSKLVASLADKFETEISSEINSQHIRSVLSQMKRQGLTPGQIIPESHPPKLNIPVIGANGVLIVPKQPPVGLPSSLPKSPSPPSSPSSPSPSSFLPPSPIYSNANEPVVYRTNNKLIMGKVPPELTTVHRRLNELKQSAQ